MQMKDIHNIFLQINDHLKIVLLLRDVRSNGKSIFMGCSASILCFI
jgi:hypothetical protein